MDVSLVADPPAADVHGGETPASIGMSVATTASLTFESDDQKHSTSLSAIPVKNQATSD